MTEETFTSNDIRGTLTAGASLDFVWNVGRALSDWLQFDGSVAIMRHEQADDSLVKALIEGVRLQGRTACDAHQGEADNLRALITSGHYAGGVLVAVDHETREVAIELFNEDGQRIDSENGLSDLEMMIEGGNMSPASAKGELVVLA